MTLRYERWYMKREEKKKKAGICRALRDSMTQNWNMTINHTNLTICWKEMKKFVIERLKSRRSLKKQHRRGKKNERESWVVENDTRQKCITTHEITTRIWCESREKRKRTEKWEMDEVLLWGETLETTKAMKRCRWYFSP